MAETEVNIDYGDYSHTGPGTLAGRYLRSFWQPLYRSHDLKSGKAVTVRALGEDFTLYRGASNQVYAVAPRCAHRGTQLSTGWVEGECIRCFYHGWVYDGSGQCLEQPAEDASFAKKIKIASYPVREYLGLVFVYLGEGKAPELPRFPFIEDVADDECVRLVHVDKKPYPFNYRNGLENSVDPVHVAFVHRNSEYRGLVGCPEVGAEETDYGLILYARRQDGEARVTQFQMPNILFIKQGPRYPGETDWRDFLLWRVPVDDESFRGFRIILAHIKGEAAERFREQEEGFMAQDPAPSIAEDVLASKMHVDEITDLRLAVTVQDYVAQKGQGVIYDRTSERLGRSDAGVILLRKIYARELRALAEGKPPTKWAVLRPAATIGGLSSLAQ